MRTREGQLMSLPITITLITDAIYCGAGGAIEYGFDIENTSEHTLTVGLEPVGECKAWVGFIQRKDAEFELPARGYRRVDVRVAVPHGAPAKRYSFRLRAYSPRTPTEAVESGAVALNVVPSGSSGVTDPKGLSEVTDPKGSSEVTGGTHKDEPKDRRPVIIAASIGGVVLIGVVLWLIFGGGKPVPDLVGKTVDEAIELLDAAGYVAPRIDEEITDELAPGLIVRQNPEPGTDKPADAVVSIVLAVAPPPELTARDAESLANRWVTAINAGDVDALVDMAEAPFFFASELLASKGDIRRKYVELLSTGERITPTRVVARTIGDFRAAGLIDDGHPITSRLKTDDDDFLVGVATGTVFIGTESVGLYFRRAGDRLEMAGFWG